MLQVLPDSLRSSLRASLAGVLEHVSLHMPDAVAVTADYTISPFGEINAVLTISNDHDIQLMELSL